MKDESSKVKISSAFIIIIIYLYMVSSFVVVNGLLLWETFFLFCKYFVALEQSDVMYYTYLLILYLCILYDE